MTSCALALILSADGSSLSKVSFNALIDNSIASTVEAIELSIKALKETLDSEEPSADKIRARAQDVTDAAMKLGEAIYKAEAQENQANEENTNSEATNEDNNDDVVDADFEDLNKTDK